MTPGATSFKNFSHFFYEMSAKKQAEHKNPALFG